MLLPREKPFLTGLNSYYLDIEKFVQHLQGEIGTGCIYCTAVNQELLVYFDEYEIVRGVTQQKGEHALFSGNINNVLESLQDKSFQVIIYYLDPDSIFFWGQLPSFKRSKDTLSSNRVSLPDLIFRLSQKEFSGFIDVDVRGENDCAVLFFHEGQRRGGSYSWGTGGLSPADADYNTLLGMLQKNEGTFSLGYFTTDPSTSASSVASANEQQETASPDSGEQGKVVEDLLHKEPDQTVLETNQAINELLAIFIKIVGPKIKTDPLVELKLKFIDFVSIYPQLDPHGNLCEIQQDGTVLFHDAISVKEAAEGIVDCLWMVIEDRKLHKKFRQEIKNMTWRKILFKQGIDLER